MKGTLEKLYENSKTAINDGVYEINENLENISDQSYRYLGGAVGVINYDAVALWEKVPQSHAIEQPLMEFGIYEDGILYDNKQKKSFYFYYDENRIDEIKIYENKFDDFNIYES